MMNKARMLLVLIVIALSLKTGFIAIETAQTFRIAQETKLP